MDPIKEAFLKIKDDIASLKDKIIALNARMNKIEKTSTDNNSSSLNDSQNLYTPTNTPTQNSPLKPLKEQNIDFSIGNEGVPTHQHTNTPTHQHTINPPNLTQNVINFNKINPINKSIGDDASEFKKATEMINSLDSIKKEIRDKFKRLTNQEMTVFSKLYTLNDSNIKVTYRLIATQLNLSESSIRDYTNKLIKKGIPIEKVKINNKTILLNISKDLKNIATLSTILQLREI